MAREVAGLSLCCAFVVVRSGFSNACLRASASSDKLLVVRGIWELLVFCDCSLLLLRATELPVCARLANLEREIGNSANGADMLYLTARLVSSHVCATVCDIFDCIARISALSPSLLYMILVRVTAFVQGL